MRTRRIRFLKDVSGVDGYFETGQVVDAAAADADAHVGAERAELAPDEPVGRRAPAPIAEYPCPVCGAMNSEWLLACTTCLRRLR